MACDIELQIESAACFGCLSGDQADVLALGRLIELAGLQDLSEAELVYRARCLTCLDSKTLLAFQAAITCLITWAPTATGDVLGTEGGDVIGTEGGDQIGID